MLEVHTNQLAALPAELGHLANLQTLQLRINQLTALPAEFGHLTGLQTLGLSDNQLTTLPAEFGELTTGVAAPRRLPPGSQIGRGQSVPPQLDNDAATC